MNKIQAFGSFTGKLYYDETDEHLYMKAFILRDKQVAFDVAIVNADDRSWSASAIASEEEPHVFVARNVPLARLSEQAALPWDFHFNIEAISSSMLYLEGHVFAEGEKYFFSGDLEKNS